MQGVKHKPVVSPRIVQPGDPWKPWLLVLFVLLLATLIWQSFEAGRLQGGFDDERAEREYQRLAERIQTLETENSSLSLDSAKYQRANQIGNEAIRASKTDMVSLLNERAELKKEVSFLRGLISAQSGPLYIRDVSLQALDEKDRQYRYTFSIAQALEDFGMTRGSLAVTLLGKQNDEEKELKLEGRKLSFVSYQKITGIVKLPDGFKPQLLRVDVKPKSKKLKKFSKNINWEIRENG